MAESTQNYKNHAKFVPMYHYVLTAILLFNFGAMAYHAFEQPDMYHVWTVVMAAPSS